MRLYSKKKKLSPLTTCLNVPRGLFNRTSRIFQISRPLQYLALSLFPHPCLYVGHFNCCHVDRGYDYNIADSECLVGCTSINIFALLCKPSILPAFTLATATLAVMSFFRTEENHKVGFKLQPHSITCTYYTGVALSTFPHCRRNSRLLKKNSRPKPNNFLTHSAAHVLSIQA